MASRDNRTAYGGILNMILTPYSLAFFKGMATSPLRGVKVNAEGVIFGARFQL
ncbi:hypothetical protein D3C72_2177630 [compost metagenome]